MSERRQEQRLPVTEEVFDAVSGRSLGFTLNVNTFGMLLVSKQAYDDGETLRIKMAMPLEGNERVSMAMSAECRWSSPLPDSKLFQNGFHFSHPSNANIAYTKTLFDAFAAS